MSTVSDWYRRHAQRLVERGVPEHEIVRIQQEKLAGENPLTAHAGKLADAHADEYLRQKGSS